MIRKLAPALAVAVLAALTVAAPAQAASKPQVTWLEASATKSSNCAKHQMVVKVLYATGADSTAARVQIAVRGDIVRNYLARDLKTGYMPGGLSKVGEYRACHSVQDRQDVRVTITAYRGVAKARLGVTAADRIWGC